MPIPKNQHTDFTQKKPLRPCLAEEICSGSGSIILGGFGENTTVHGYFRFDTRGFEEAS
jgi:hypothetical protein